MDTASPKLVALQDAIDQSQNITFLKSLFEEKLQKLNALGLLDEIEDVIKAKIKQKIPLEAGHFVVGSDLLDKGQNMILLLSYLCLVKLV